MTKYLISFDKGAMDHIPDEDFPEVGKASHAVVQDARDAGVFLFAGGLDYDDMGLIAMQGVEVAGASVAG